MDALTSATMVRTRLYPWERSSRLTQQGHAGAMLQARRLGTELLVGIHSDEDILENKGPTVMTLQERCVALQELERSV
jgi:glycerol-3-phosphate cytidylyltransferase-like family protein